MCNMFKTALAVGLVTVAVTITASAEFQTLLPKNESVTYNLTNNGKAVLTFTANEGTFKVNDKVVYENAVANLWYRLRFELDTKNKTIIVKVNGRNAAEVAFAGTSSSVTSLDVVNNSGTEVLFDDFKVYRMIDHDDYVSEPVKPSGDENYTIGINVCSLWRNGDHFGRSCITPYSDIQPVLGYYDEGSPESADWEIKYLAEHGVDFEAFCVYFTKRNGSACCFSYSSQLYDGYMNAKYSDKLKYCIIFEAANGASAYSLDEWKTQYAPYIVENFFKDERYMVIDNKPVMCVFGSGTISQRAGSQDNARAMFDYLEEQAKNIGYDGVIFLGGIVNGTDVSSFPTLGYDGCYAYNWGVNGYSAEENKTNIMNYVKSDKTYCVPTVSVGFNNVAWANTRHALMDCGDYENVHKWVRDEYLPNYAKETWQKNFLFLSTWNEYGEGTYIMPTADERGFGYLDAVRKVYTKETDNTAVDVVPTPAQLERITHLYPQYRQLLRKQGFETEATLYADYKVKYIIDMASAAYGVANMNNAYQDSDGVTGVAKNNDPIVGVKTVENIDLDDVAALRLTAKIPAGGFFQIYYSTEAEPSLDEEKSVSVQMKSGAMETVLIDMTGKKKWTGKLKSIRFDPGSQIGSTVTVKSLEFLQSGETTQKASKYIHINSMKCEMSFEPEKTSDGDWAVAFDPKIGLDFRLDVFHLWNKEKGEMTLNFKNHIVVFTVGSNKYLLDGKEMTLADAIWRRQMAQTQSFRPHLPPRFLPTSSTALTEKATTLSVKRPSKPANGFTGALPLPYRKLCQTTTRTASHSTQTL